jgi:GH24 family phage-related lysozyme (muramidase)
MVYTQRECDQDLIRMTAEYLDAVTPFIPKGAPDSVYAAFTSTAINIGKTGWRGSQLKSGWVPAPYMAALARGDYRAACDLLAAPWPGKYGTAPGYKATVGGYPSKGLGNRRSADAGMCRSGLK